MKNLLLLFFFMFVQNTSAQLRPSQSQYLKEMGVLVNPGFEQGLEGWTLTGGCTSSFVSDVPFLNRSLRLSCTNAQFSVSQTSTDLSNFAGQQALASVQVKVSAGSVKVANLANATREHELTINSGDYKKAEIPFVANATSNGIEIFTDTNITADVTIDLAEVSLAPNLIQQVSDAQYIGGIEVFDEGPGCGQSASAATFQDWPADTDCGYRNTEGDLSAPSTDGLVGFTLSNVRTDGVYLVTAIGGYWAISSGPGTKVCHNAIGETGDIGSADLPSNFALRGADGSSVEAWDGGATKARYFKFDSNTDKQIRMLFKREAGSSNCSYTVGGLWPTVRFEVTFYPDSTSNVVTQTQELTAETANLLSARILADGTVSSENFNFLDGDCDNPATGIADCSFVSGLFTTIPSITASSCESGTSPDENLAISELTLSGFRATARNLVNSNQATEFCINVIKQGSDFKKSQTIVGNFGKTIESTEQNVRQVSCQINQTTGTPEIDTDSGLCESFVDTVDDVGIGNARVNFLPNTFSRKPVCTCIATEDITAGSVSCMSNRVGGGFDKDKVTFRIFNHNNVASDVNFMFTCTGIR